MSSTLSDNIHNQIKALCAEGDLLCEGKQYDLAVAKYRAALELLPEPIKEWEAATWIFVAIGDALFATRDFQNAADALLSATNCPGGIGNPFLHLRLGQTQYELGNEILAKDELARAYMGGGKKIFDGEDPKYFELVKRTLRQPPAGW